MIIGKVIKKITSILLIVAMVMTSAGIQTFASSVGEAVHNAVSESEKNEDIFHKYYDETKERESKETHAPEDETGALVNEPEDETSAQVNEPEDETGNASEEETDAKLNEPEEDEEESETYDVKETSHKNDDKEGPVERSDETIKGAADIHPHNIEDEGDFNVASGSETHEDEEGETRSHEEEEEDVASTSEVDDEESVANAESEAHEDDANVASESEAYEEDIDIASASEADEDTDIASASEASDGIEDAANDNGSDLENVETANILDLQPIMGDNNENLFGGPGKGLSFLWDDVVAGNNINCGGESWYVGRKILPHNKKPAIVLIKRTNIPKVKMPLDYSGLSLTSSHDEIFQKLGLIQQYNDIIKNWSQDEKDQIVEWDCANRDNKFASSSQKQCDASLSNWIKGLLGAGTYWLHARKMEYDGDESLTVRLYYVTEDGSLMYKNPKNGSTVEMYWIPTILMYPDVWFSITWDLKDGSSTSSGSWNGTKGSDTYHFGEDYILPTDITGPTGRPFDHWEIGGKKVEKISSTDYGNKTVKAVYKNEEYKITWDLEDGNSGNKGSWNGTAGASKYTYNTGIAKLPTNVKGPTGRNFDYWTIGGTKATSIASNATGEKTIKAVYKDKEYNIQFKARKAKASDGVDYGNGKDGTVTKYKYPNKITMPKVSDYEIEGFEFIGFSKNSNATTATWLPNTEYNIKDMSFSETETNIIYPIYKEKEVTIDFYVLGATLSNGQFFNFKNENKNKKYKYYSNVTFPVDVHIAGLDLIGYETKDSDVTYFVEAAVPIKVQTLVKAGKLKLDVLNKYYGVFKEKEYKLEILGGSKVVGDKTYTSSDKVDAIKYLYYGSVTMPATPSMTMKGFKLVGFSKDDRQETAQYTPEQVVNVKDIVSYVAMQENDGTDATINTLYAVWKVTDEAATVTFDADIGYFASSYKRSKTLILDDKTAALKTYADYEEPVILDGFEFDSWVDSNGVKWTKDDIIVHDESLKATYKKVGGGDLNEEEKQKYTVKILNDIDKGVVKVSGVESTDVEFSIKAGDKVLETLTNNAITLEDKPGWNFEGWSFTGDINNLIKDSDTYTDTDKASITAMYTQIINVNVTLKANTGLFDDATREKKLIASVSTILGDFNLYEEPKKSGDYVFEKWIDQYGNDIKATDIIYKDKILKAVYKDSKTGKEVGSDDDTSDEGKDATYTVALVTDTAKGTLDSGDKFEVKKDALIYNAMVDAKVATPNTTEKWNFWGWSFTDDVSDIIDETTAYTDITKTKLYAEYYEKGAYTVVLNANTGLFSDNETVKTLVKDKWMILNKFDDYEVPEKSDGYTFESWVDESGNKVAEDTLITSLTPTILYATYKDPSGKDIGEPGSGTDDGGDNASYTVRLSSDDTKGLLGAVKKFEVKIDDLVLSSMRTAGVIKPYTIGSNVFAGWSFDNSYYTALKEDSKYVDSTKRVLYAMYSDERCEIRLDANTGLFADNSRVKVLDATKYQLLTGVVGYEEPAKSDGYTFIRWERNGLAIDNLQEYLVDENATFTAVYRDPNGNEVGHSDATKDGGEDAIYTIRVINDDTEGTYTGVEFFEIAKDANVMTTMNDSGVEEGVGNADHVFLGWAFNGTKYIDRTTIYENTNWTTLVVSYVLSTFKSVITFDAWAGEFSDGSKVRTNVDVAAGRIINTLSDYEEPRKENWTFSRWVDINRQTVASTSTIKSGDTLFSARYFDEYGNEVGDGDHSHYVCGTSECIHTDGVLRVHSYGNSYKAVTNGEEIVNYVNAELAKAEADRKNVYVYLSNDVELNDNIELDTNIKLYICLNGYNLKTKKILAKVDSTNSEVIISNCKEVDTVVSEIESEDKSPMFGTNGVHIFGGKNTLTIKTQGALVNTKGGSSTTEKEIALQKVNLVGGNVEDNTDFISVEGSSNVKLVDTNIKDVVVKDAAIVKVATDSGLLIGNDVVINNNISNKAIIDDDGIFNIVDNANLTVSENTIEKIENGANGIILLGSNKNYVSGDLTVTNNKLTVGEDYYSILTEATTKEPGLLGSIFGGLFGAFAEVESPAGDVGYTAAIGFKNEKTSIEVKDSKIVVIDNKSDEKAKDLKAGYMYNVLSRDMTTPVFEQVRGTTLNADSNIGIAFTTTDGQGNITTAKGTSKDIYKSTTYGKEDKILSVKENTIGYGIGRKDYVVEYDEGAPITKESNTLIPVLTRDEATVSEALRIRTDAIVAGYDTMLEDDTIYRAIGFDLASYSIVRPSDKLKGTLNPRATLSYVDNVYDEDDEIGDSEVIRAVANWEERKLKSEAREMVITKEEYDQMAEEAVKNAESSVASYSEADQVEIESDDDYYTVRYWLDGGHFDGSEVPENGYVEDTKANRKNKYVLSTDVIKEATESDIQVTYDFIGWSLKKDTADNPSIDDEDDNDDIFGRSEVANVEIINELEAGYEGELVELVANYRPSTYKITYHLNGGNINGNTEDVEDIIARKSNYILIKHIDKAGNAFIGWTEEDAEVSEENPIIKEFKAESVEGDIEVYAQYDVTTYSVKYYLDGGKISGIDTVDDVYVDDTADRTKDYHYVEDVYKEGYDFLGWVTVDGEILVDTIEAGNNDVTLREVKAKYRSITYTVKYDTDGGVIVGVDSNVANPEVGKIYKLYTNVEKEGYEFLGWYDAQTDQKILSIGSAQIGEVFNVKAKWAKLTYDLTLHLEGGVLESVGATGDYIMQKVSNKLDFVLPTDITKDDEEFSDWYYLKDGVHQTIDTIKAGNAENITDVYARYKNLKTHNIRYYLNYESWKRENITPVGDETKIYMTTIGEDAYQVYGTTVSRRDDYVLNTNVTKIINWSYFGTTEEREFVGWTLNKKYEDNLIPSKNLIVKVKPGISVEDELEGAKINDTYDYYAYFETKKPDKINIKYMLDGGKLVGKTSGVESVYVDSVSADASYNIDQNAVKDGYRFDGWYRRNDYEGTPQTVLTPQDYSELVGDTIPLYAKWTKVRYGLKYFVKGGTMPGKILTSGNAVYRTEFENIEDTVLDTDIVKEGYTFDGWYDGEGKDAVKVEVIPAGTDKDIEVYARWIKATYVVTYVLNGGKIEGVTDDTYKVTYDKNSKTTLITDIEKAGHKFLGWSKGTIGGEKIEAIEKSDVELEDITVFADWKDVRYTVKYVLDGGIIKGKKLDTEGNYEEVYDSLKEVVLYDGEKVSRGYDKFLGWVDENGKSWETIPVDHEGNLTLKATYKIAMVELVYNFAGGILPGLTTKDDTTYTVKYNSTMDYSLITDIEWQVKMGGKPIWVFDGWQTKDGKKITTIPKDSTEEIREVTATWYYGAYQVACHVDGGSIGTTGPDAFGLIMLGGNVYSEKKLPTNVTKTNSIFEGWYLNEDFSGEPITAIPAFPTYPIFKKDYLIHIYAKWKQEHYNVTYNVGDGAFKDVDATGNTLKVKVENKYPYILLDEENLSYKGYEFDGWYKKNGKGDFVGKPVVWIDAANKENYELYAKFVNLETATDEEKEELDKNKRDRQSKKTTGINKKNEMIQEDAKLAGDNVKVIYTSTEQGIYTSPFATQLVEEDQNRNKNKKEANETKSQTNKSSDKSLLGTVAERFTSLFGANDESNDTQLFGDDEADKEDVEFNMANLNAYDSISAKNLGVTAQKGFIFDSFIVTYLLDEDGNDIDDNRLLGAAFKEGDNLAAISETYPNCTVGGRVIFIDESIVKPEEPTTPEDPKEPSKPNKPNRPTPPGGGGGSSGSRNNTSSTFDQGRLLSSLINVTVNAYGYDGKGIDNGSLRASLLKQQINILFGRDAVTKVENYKTIDLSSANSKTLSYSSVNWEYFPASNAFKLYAIDKTGEKYYLVNGWYKSTANLKDTWYRFDKDGLMQRGFVEEGGKVYYLNNTINELGYMVQGFKDFEGTAYTGYFGNDGSLITIIPTESKASFENNMLALPTISNYDTAVYAACKQIDSNRTKILKTVKTHGQSSLGNFVGYWYYMAKGNIKFSFETINTELQVARFANNGWINIYDNDNQLYSYRFDENANLIVNTTTPEGILLDAKGHMANQKLLFDFGTIDKSNDSNYVFAGTTVNGMRGDIKVAQSHTVSSDGTHLDVTGTPATDFWTEIDLRDVDPVLTNMTYVSAGLNQPLQMLQNTTEKTENEIQNTDSNTIAASGAKVIQVLSTDVMTVANAVNENTTKAVRDVCSYLYNFIKNALVA